jgi:glycosyltransferase involved in cell wall biosynthesis
VINPLPWSPVHRFIDRLSLLENVPDVEVLQGVEVHHPRFFSIPKFFKQLEPKYYQGAVERCLSELGVAGQGDFDIVDMHWTFPDLPAGLAIAERMGARTIVTLRGMEAMHENDGRARSLAVDSGLRQVDRIIALSQELKLEADRRTQAPDKALVVRNGVSIEQFYYIEQKQARQSVANAIESPAIISVGSLIYRKGFDLLIEALHRLRLRSKFSNCRLYIVGSEGPEGDYRKRLFAQVEQLGLQNAVEFVGQVPNNELIDWYNACDVFCLASRGEGSPNVLTEAIACGCPAVSADVGSAREIVESEPDLGVCVEPDSADALYDGLYDILSRKLDRKHNATVFSRYSWDWCANNVLPVYQSVLEKRD